MRVPDDMRELLDDDEKVYVIVKPRFLPYMLSRVFRFIIVTVFLILFLSIFIRGLYSVPPLPEFSLIYFLSIFIMVVSLAIILSPVIHPLLVWRNIYYLITDRRILVRKGIFGIDYDILDMEYVEQVNINRGVWDRVFGSGTIIVQAIGVSSLMLYNVPAPIKIQRVIRERISSMGGGERI